MIYMYIYIYWISGHLEVLNVSIFQNHGHYEGPRLQEHETSTEVSIDKNVQADVILNEQDEKQKHINFRIPWTSRRKRHTIQLRWDKLYTIYKKRSANSPERKDWNNCFYGSCLLNGKEKERVHFILNKMAKSKNPHVVINKDVHRNSSHFVQHLQNVSII